MPKLTEKSRRELTAQSLAREIESLRQRVEDLEDLHDLNDAITKNNAQPGKPGAAVKRELGI